MLKMMQYFHNSSRGRNAKMLLFLSEYDLRPVLKHSGSRNNKFSRKSCDSPCTINFSAIMSMAVLLGAQVRMRASGLRRSWRMASMIVMVFPVPRLGIEISIHQSNRHIQHSWAKDNKWYTPWELLEYRCDCFMLLIVFLDYLPPPRLFLGLSQCASYPEKAPSSVTC